MAHRPGRAQDPKRPDEERAARRDFARHRLAVLAAAPPQRGTGGGQVHAQQARADPGQEPGDAGGPEQVADGVGDRDVVAQQPLRLGAAVEPGDGVAGAAEYRRLGQRAGEQPCRRPLVVAEQHGSRVRGQQPGDGQDQGQGGQTQALPS